MKKYFKTLIPTTLIILFIVMIIIPQLQINSRCVTYNEFLNKKIHAVIINKYIDSSQHSYETLELKDLNSYAINKLILDFDTTDLFGYLRLSDTIYKEKNKDSIFLIKTGKKSFFRKIDFGCVQ